MSAILSEHEELTTEHESLVSRHDKLLGDMEANETKWRQKVQQTEEQCLVKLQQQTELVEQLRNENILTSTAFKVSKLLSCLYISDGNTKIVSFLVVIVPLVVMDTAH